MRSYHELSLRACFGSRGDTGPFIHLNARQQLIGAIVRSKDRGLALFYVEPVLAQRGNDVWIVRDENSVGARLRRYAELARHFSDDEIIELGLFCAEVDGVGKFVKSLNVLSWEEACELNPKLRAASTSRVAAE
jgi:hypothetical protein